MIEVREATEEDNQTLIKLQTKCPQGTSIILNIDSSPDFFARSKPFKDWAVLIALDNGKAVGSAGYAINEVLVGGKPAKTAYEYGFMVDPQERRKGIATKLQERVEQDMEKKGVDLLCLTIIEDNTPSFGLFSKMGFRKIKDCATFSLMVYKKQTLTKENSIRSAEKSDLGEVATMFNNMYRGYDFFHPLTAEDLLDYVGRMQGFDLNSLFIFEDDQGMKACLGCWDYTKVRRYIVQKFNWRLKTQLSLLKLAGLFTAMPRIPKSGEPLLSYNLTLLAFKDAESMTDLVKYAINMAVRNRISLLHVPLDLENPTAETLSHFRHTKIGLQFLVKPLPRREFPSFDANKLYIDATEI
jgi:GNAT superfamily N-acetyltransferase